MVYLFLESIISLVTEENLNIARIYEHLKATHV